MADIRTWLDKGDKSSERVPLLLPILIRQARLETAITYGDVAREIGVHHRAVHHIAGYIGFTLSAVGERRGWVRRPPPPLHALIVNDITRLPGKGIDGFMAVPYRKARTQREKRAVLKSIYADARSYPHWEEMCELIGVPFVAGALADAVEAARQSPGRGGEGPEHRALKMFVKNNPGIVGLSPGGPPGEDEYPTASGDRIDVLFTRNRMRLAVEVKPYNAPESDMLRGVFQCFKYRAVLEAEAAVVGSKAETKTLLVLGGPVTPKVIQIANRLGINIKDNVRPRG